MRYTSNDLEINFNDHDWAGPLEYVRDKYPLVPLQELIARPWAGPREEYIRRTMTIIEWWSFMAGTRIWPGVRDLPGIQEYPDVEKDKILRDIWRSLVQQVYEERKSYVSIRTLDGGRRRDIDLTVLPDTSAWKQYTARLDRKKKWSPVSLAQLQIETSSIFSRLDTDQPPFKGLVVGHVQSGKTASMIGIIALAADHGFNVFIILSGLIDNLRNQTEDRILEELQDPDFQNLHNWQPIYRVAGNQIQMARNLDFTGNNRYVHVSLKNSHHLNRVKRWLNQDRNFKRNMRVLLIDDEADQATPRNTPAEEAPNPINRQITEIVHDEDYKELCYLGYTATPYANVLSVAPGQDRGVNLYPKDFIGALSAKPDYFGCSSIFGEFEREPLSLIVRSVRREDIVVIEDIHSGNGGDLPASMKNAVDWFLLSVCIRRFRGDKEPTSMLIHTSHLTVRHERVYNALRGYLDCFFGLENTLEATERLRRRYQEQKDSFTLHDFWENFPDYPYDILDYPAWDDIKELVSKFLSEPVSFIQIDGNDSVQYHAGLHVCVDNSQFQETSDNGYNLHTRLLFPLERDQNGEAFLIIGGNTLSRGLTLRGLVSSWFLRDSSTAGDSLMQMGRWFGYRKGYELLQRVWVSELTQDKFSHLSRLESDFRDAIKLFEEGGRTLSESPIGVLNDLFRLRATSMNRMRAARSVEFFQGSAPQTTRFPAENNSELYTYNMAKTLEFIEFLKRNYSIPTEAKSGRFVVTEVHWSHVADYIASLRYHDDQDWFPDCREKLKQVGNHLESPNWNIVFSGTVDDTNPKWPGANVRGLRGLEKVRRTILRDASTDMMINIRSLRTAQDLLADIPVDIPRPDSSKSEVVQKFRKEHGVADHPLLIIYCIDGNQKNGSPGPTRMPIQGMAEDIIGLAILFPGRKNEGDYLTVDGAFIDRGVEEIRVELDRDAVQDSEREFDISE